MRMDWDQSKGPRLDGPGQWVEIENVVAGLCANVFLSKLQCFGNPAAGVSSYQGRPSLGSRSPGVFFRFPHIGKASVEDRACFLVREAFRSRPDFLLRLDLDYIGRIPGQLPIIDCPTEHRFYSGQIAILQGLGSDHVETGILKRKHILL